MLLPGHTSVKVTERHDAPWVRERQEQAEADVKRAWAQDPVALLESKGTQSIASDESKSVFLSTDTMRSQWKAGASA
jgi:hypothetical protein